MIGIHSRPRSVPVWNFFPAPKGNQTAKSPETNRKTTSLPSFDGAHESTENVTRQSGSLPITSGRGTCGGSDGSVSSSNTSLQLIDGDNSAENSSDQEQHISLPRESLTRLDQSISDPLNASGCVSKFEVRYLHHCSQNHCRHSERSKLTPVQFSIMCCFRTRGKSKFTNGQSTTLSWQHRQRDTQFLQRL